MKEIYMLVNKEKPVGISEEIENLEKDKLHKLANECLHDAFLIFRMIGWHQDGYGNQTVTPLSLIAFLADELHNLPRYLARNEMTESAKRDISFFLESLYVFRKNGMITGGLLSISMFEELTEFKPIFGVGHSNGVGNCPESMRILMKLGN